jgi:cellulose biosynthesis protein BcsQ
MIVKVLVAVNMLELENYIGCLREVEVCEIVREKKNLVGEIRTHKPQVVVISNMLTGDEDIHEILTELAKKEFSSVRIIYLYGRDDKDRKSFINFLKHLGIYDIHVGIEVTSEDIQSLLFCAKSKRTLLDEAEYKGKCAACVIAIVGPKGVGKTFVASNLARMCAKDRDAVSLVSISDENQLEHFFKINGLLNNIDNQIENIKSKEDVLNAAYKLKSNIFGFQGNYSDKYVFNSFLINRLSSISKIILLDISADIKEDKILEYADLVVLVTKQEKKFDELTHEFIKVFEQNCFSEEKLVLVINEYTPRASSSLDMVDNVNAMFAAVGMKYQVALSHVFEIYSHREAFLLGIKNDRGAYEYDEKLTKQFGCLAKHINGDRRKKYFSFLRK